MVYRNVAGHTPRWHMQTTDPYLQEAFTAAQRYAAVDSRFQLADGPLIQQGLNNRVLRGIFDGQPVIAKYYGDGFRWNISGDLRRQRELTFLRRAENTGLVPRVITAYERFILLE